MIYEKRDNKQAHLINYIYSTLRKKPYFIDKVTFSDCYIFVYKNLQFISTATKKQLPFLYCFT